GIRQGFRLRTERFLLRQVRGPLVLASFQVVVTTGEEPIAGGTESLPHRFFLTAADRTDGFPFGLQRLNLRCRLDPVRRVGERFHPFRQRLLLRQIGGALFVLRREVRRRPVVDLLLGGLESTPRRFTLGARRQRHFLPPRL